MNLDRTNRLNLALWKFLPQGIHTVICHLTGWRIVMIIERDPDTRHATGQRFIWSRRYPLERRDYD